VHGIREVPGVLELGAELRRKFERQRVPPGKLHRLERRAVIDKAGEERSGSVCQEAISEVIGLETR
jgi:hypothetical protein